MMILDVVFFVMSFRNAGEMEMEPKWVYRDKRIVAKICAIETSRPLLEES